MPAWAYIVPIWLGLGFIVGALCFIAFGPQPMARPIGAIWLVMDAGFVFVCVRALRGRKDEEEIREHGVRATATLLGAKTTGSFVNTMPQWKFRLRIDGNGPSYETTLLVLTFNPPENGAGVDVRVDPQRKEHVVLAGADGDIPVIQPHAPDAAPAQAQANQSGMTATANPDGSVTYTSK
ncbi:MAG: hypothetical protein QOD51_1516 [Candidatus Eremiobacteraeota bacterium]|jgi:hypothetical protein|nr:hypothetical protein [Candidatus Eremiobacteraeota bacterium]